MRLTLLENGELYAPEPRGRQPVLLIDTGGDQLKITSQLGDSVMSETMLISGAGDESHKLGSVLGMAPGLGLIQDVVIDQHFAERGRLGRLLAAITHRPGLKPGATHGCA